MSSLISLCLNSEYSLSLLLALTFLCLSVCLYHLPHLNCPYMALLFSNLSVHALNIFSNFLIFYFIYVLHFIHVFI